MNARMLELMRGAQAMRPRIGSGPVAMLDPRELIHEARLKKRPEELDAMRHAVAISCEAHKDAMRRARGGMMEWEIEALVDYAFRSRGAAGPSYPSIIASGPNAATLHYINNDRKMLKRRTAADRRRLRIRLLRLRRDPHLSGRRALQPAPARALRGRAGGAAAAIESIKPGVRFDDVHEAALRVLVEGMIDLGLVKGPRRGRDRDGRLSPLLHASHQPLARDGRA